MLMPMLPPFSALRHFFGLWCQLSSIFAERHLRWWCRHFAIWWCHRWYTPVFWCLSADIFSQLSIHSFRRHWLLMLMLISLSAFIFDLLMFFIIIVPAAAMLSLLYWFSLLPLLLLYAWCWYWACYVFLWYAFCLSLFSMPLLILLPHAMPLFFFAYLLPFCWFSFSFDFFDWFCYAFHMLMPLLPIFDAARLLHCWLCLRLMLILLIILLFSPLFRFSCCHICLFSCCWFLHASAFRHYDYISPPAFRFFAFIAAFSISDIFIFS